MICFSSVIAQTTIDPENLINELGCGNCHLGAEKSTLIPVRAPNLSNAGSKYNSSYIFDYLKAPHSIRKNIGLSRMPNFNLSDKEAFALTIYLETKKSLTSPKHYNNGDKNLDPVKLITDDYFNKSSNHIRKFGNNILVNL